MDEVGYTLYHCQSEEEIQSFRKYYAPNISTVGKRVLLVNNVAREQLLEQLKVNNHWSRK